MVLWWSYGVPGTGNGIVMHPNIHLAIFGTWYKYLVPGTVVDERRMTSRGPHALFKANDMISFMLPLQHHMHACMFHIYLPGYTSNGRY